MLGLSLFFFSLIREALKPWAITAQGSVIQLKSFSNEIIIPRNLTLCLQMSHFEFLMIVEKQTRKKGVRGVAINEDSEP